MEVIKIKPIGYCFGVINAINLALKIKKEYPNNNVYLFGQIVHNNDVTNMLLDAGIITIDTTSKDKISLLNEFKKDDIVIFSAHGHDKKYDDILIKNGIKFFDATCPKVSKNNDLIKKEVISNKVIFIGKIGHPETEASLSISNNVILYDIKNKMDYSLIDVESPLVVNQTTLSFLEIEDIHQDIKNHFPKARIIDEICDATRLRQEKISSLKEKIDIFIIIGSNKSSNTDKLYQIAKNKYQDSIPVIKVENLDDLLKYDLSNIKKVAIASGTSTPLKVVDEMETYLKGVN
jgi:4-hydroxy-3-methylbut-2-en-1-yl diphosphate reductase